MTTATHPTQVRYRTKGETALIEIRLNEAKQLFDNRDPSPFIARDLDPDAVEYLVGAVGELKSNQRFEIVIYVAKDYGAVTEEHVREGIHNYFSFQMQLLQSRTKNKLRRARRALLMALVFLFLAVGLSKFVALNAPPGMYRDVFSEGLMIIGWVAMWRPLESVLYDWWQLSDAVGVHERLARCPVSLLHETA